MTTNTEPMDTTSSPLTLAKLDELINGVEGGATVLWTAAGEIPLGVPVEQMTTEQLAAAKSLALNNGIRWDKLRERLERPLPELLTEPIDTPRDPHLPPPAVCDWLLEQTWPGVIPEIRIDFQGGSPEGVAGSHLIGYQQARVEIGADEIGRIFLPDEALDALRKDAAARRGQPFALRFLDSLLEEST